MDIVPEVISPEEEQQRQRNADTSEEEQMFQMLPDEENKATTDAEVLFQAAEIMKDVKRHGRAQFVLKRMAQQQHEKAAMMERIAKNQWYKNTEFK